MSGKGNKRALSLLELNGLVRATIEGTLRQDFWVEAEVSEARESRGHCYMELVQKAPDGSTPVARASAKCWRQTWALLKPHFERATGQTLHAGLQVMLCVRAQFHEAYGFSWIVSDIDPTYTLGDMARKRLEIIRQLKEEGVFDLNRELELPMFTQRIAVISSPTAAGYGDFCNQLAANAYGYTFATRLFEAAMQGEQVEQSVIAALERINAEAQDFDCVAIIRGGGATSDMSGFDTLALAEHVANFPLPVITGIGHDRDESVLDMVSHTRVKTPTAAAALLVERLRTVEVKIDALGQRAARRVQATLGAQRTRLAGLAERLPGLVAVVRTRSNARIVTMSTRLAAAATGLLAARRHRIEMMEAAVRPLPARAIEAGRHRIELLAGRAAALDPALLLRRGYSITTLAGRAVRDASLLKGGDEIETTFEKGKTKSTVK